MKKILAGATITSLLLPLLAYGAMFKADDSVIVALPVQENLYAAGGTVNVISEINGDAMLAGGNVIVNGNISEDVTVAGGTVNINGQIGGDLRAVGGNVTVAGSVEGDLIVTGGSINILPNVIAGKDSAITGGDIVLNGAFQDVRVYAGSLSIGPATVIRGTLNYSSPEEALIDPAAKIGKVEFHQTKTGRDKDRLSLQALIGFITLGLLVKLLIILVAASILVKFWGSTTRESLSQAINSPGKALLWGLAIFAATPLAVILAAITVIGIIPAAVIALLYAILLILSCIFGGILTGAILIKVFWKKSGTEATWFSIILGITVFGLLKFIPFIGWAIWFIIFLIALGSLGHSFFLKAKPDSR